MRRVVVPVLLVAELGGRAVSLAGPQPIADQVIVDEHLADLDSVDGLDGRDYVRVVIVATVDVGDVDVALDLAWWAFRKAASDGLAGWDLASAEAEVRPEGR